MIGKYFAASKYWGFRKLMADLTRNNSSKKNGTVTTAAYCKTMFNILLFSLVSLLVESVDIVGRRAPAKVLGIIPNGVAARKATENIPDMDGFCIADNMRY